MEGQGLSGRGGGGGEGNHCGLVAPWGGCRASPPHRELGWFLSG
jgi:hypothetical protein